MFNLGFIYLTGPQPERDFARRVCSRVCYYPFRLIKVLDPDSSPILPQEPERGDESGPFVSACEAVGGDQAVEQESRLVVEVAFHSPRLLDDLVNEIGRPEQFVLVCFAIRHDIHHFIDHHYRLPRRIDILPSHENDLYGSL